MRCFLVRIAQAMIEIKISFGLESIILENEKNIYILLHAEMICYIEKSLKIYQNSDIKNLKYGKCL